MEPVKSVKGINNATRKLSQRNIMNDLRVSIKSNPSFKATVNKAVEDKQKKHKYTAKRSRVSNQLVKKFVKERMSQLMRQSKKMVGTQLVCGNGGFCHSFNKTGSEDLKRIFNGYTDFDLINKHEKLNEGANGAVEKIVYKKNDLKSVAILKTSLKNNADNLVYEYIVGKCFINRIKNCFPCFCETYALYSSFKGFGKDDRRMKNTIMTDELLKVSCSNPSQFAVLTEYVESEKTLYSLFRNKKDSDEKILYCMFQVYFALAALRKNFTHYDLHASNVIVYEPKPGHYIEYKYEFSDNTTVSFKSRYCVKIIDYGRCFFDNTNLFGYKTNASISANRKDEPVDSNAFVSPPSPSFMSSRVLHEKLKTFRQECLLEGKKEGYYGEDINGYTFYFKEKRTESDWRNTLRINFDNKNESYDLKLFENIYGNKDVQYQLNGWEILKSGLLRGSFERNDVSNVYDACQLLAERIKQPKETYENNAMYPSEFNKIGELIVYSDGREMEWNSLNNHSVKRAGKTRKSKK